MITTAKDLRRGMKIDGRWTVTSNPIPSAMGAGWVSYSIECSGLGGIRKEPGDTPHEVAA